MSEVLEDESVEDLRRELELRKRLQKQKETHGVYFYKPHTKQDKFHKAGKFRYRYLRTGNRFGKSQCGAAEDVAFALGERPWYPKDDPARYVGIPKHATKGVIVCENWAKAEEIFTSQEAGERRGKLFDYIPVNALEGVKRNHGGHVSKIMVKSIHGGTSVIYIYTVQAYKQDPMSAESSDWDWIHIDEPVPKDLWTAVSRGTIDRRGKAWFTCTPLRHMWINHFFVPRNRIRDDFGTPLEEGDYKWAMTGSMRDNPTLSPEAIEEFLKEIPADEAECRVEGIPKALAGLVYKEFDRDVHMYSGQLEGWNNDWDVPADWTLRLAIDPHPKTPHAVLMVATSPLGRSYFFHEIFQPGSLTLLCEGILSVVNGHHIQDCLVDPLAYIEDPEDGKAMVDVFIDHGLPVAKATKDLNYGILKARKMLKDTDNEGRPLVKFHEDLDETLFEFDNYSWDPKRERPIDAEDHMMENFYRLVLSGLEYVAPPSGEISRPAKLDYKKFDTALPRPKQIKPSSESHIPWKNRSTGARMRLSERYPG